MTHTPAPWHADEHMRVVGANGDVICDVDPFDVLDAAQANLVLITAAPELFEALDHIRKHLQRASDGLAVDLDALVDLARAAIAKAEDA
jgi:hypothetical protein